MRAVGYRMSRVLRARWRAMSTLSLIVGAVTGIVLAFAAGAERTASAPDRYTAASRGGYDAEVQQESGRPRTSEVAGLPGVSSIEALTFVFGGLADPEGAPVPDALVFTGSHRALGTRLTAGREPSPESRTEFVATRSFVDAKGVKLGARLDLFTITQEQADTAGFDAFGTEGAARRSLEAVLVGVVDGPAQLNDATPLAVMPISLLDDPDIGVASTIMAVELRAGTNRDDFRDVLDTLPNGDQLSVEPFELISAEVRTAVDGQARGLWVLAAVGAIAALVVLGQFVTREVRLSAAEMPRLEAIGFNRRQLLAEQVGRALVPVLAGTALAVAVATGLSPAFPNGFVRRIEPHPGLRFDATVLALGAAGMLVAVLGWVVVTLALARPVARAGQPSPVVEAVAVRSGNSAFSTGFRFAFTRSRRDRGSIRGTVAGMLVTAAVVVGAMVFGSSLGRLLTDEARFGYNFDAGFGSGGDTVPDDVRDRFRRDPDVAGLTLYGIGQGRVGRMTLGLAGFELVKGYVAPKMLTGRLPASEDEIALGRLAAKSLGAGVGDQVTIKGPGPARRFRVTGLAVVPSVEGLDGVGQDGVVTMRALARLDPEIQPSAATVTFREGAPAGTAERLGVGPFSDPVVITNLARIRSIPFVLAGLVGALAVLTVVHVMVTSVRHRRRDVAVLRSLGADSRWISRVVHWQATTFSLVPLALGVPIGLVAGRLLFRTFADAVGTVPDASFPYALLAVVTLGMVVLANAVTVVPARRARRSAAAPLLSSE
ncbi:MAG TPA: FtsX-like permease family protein [Acidimicrobiales bacterium]|nr:FtsX-like permease family protein [Acidimicrobiales bacterium]